MPTSLVRIAANRRNALKSTGPRTPEGKRRSSQNNRKHGLRSKDFNVYNLVDPERYHHLLNCLIEDRQPNSLEELRTLQSIAANTCISGRLMEMETKLVKAILYNRPERYDLERLSLLTQRVNKELTNALDAWINLRNATQKKFSPYEPNV